MKFNNIDVRRYAESYGPWQAETVRLWLEVFKCCPELQDALQVLRDEQEKRDIYESQRQVKASVKRQAKIERKQSEAKGMIEPREPVARKIQEFTKLRAVIGFCPKCGGNLRGEPTPGCEQKKSGRMFYKECQTCTYYAEVWKKKNKYHETEGG
jgi:hypothetical protein